MVDRRMRDQLTYTCIALSLKERQPVWNFILPNNVLLLVILRVVSHSGEWTLCVRSGEALSILIILFDVQVWIGRSG
jgi:hypothetical protein